MDISGIMPFLMTIFCTFFVCLYSVYMITALFKWDVLWPRDLTTTDCDRIVAVAGILSIAVTLKVTFGG